MSDDPRMMSIHDVALALGVSDRVVYRMLRNNGFSGPVSR